MAVSGRTMPGRILWALWHSERMLQRGLTGPEVAELLTRAGVKTAPNNIMRAVRQDRGRFFSRNPSDGRAVQLMLTEEGRRMAQQLLSQAG
jgi:hypothetical protein